jgi:acyl transferase domain-containing protein
MSHESAPGQPHRPPIAILGMAGILPGADTLAGYLRNVLRQRCFVRDLPAGSWEEEIFHAAERSVPLTRPTRLGVVIGADPPELDLANATLPAT